MWLTTLLSAVLFLGLIFLYKVGTRYHDYFDKKHIEYIKPAFLLGGNFDIAAHRISMPDQMKKWGRMFQNKKVFGFFDYWQPVFVIRDPDMIKKLTINDGNYFLDRTHTLDEKFDPILGRALVSLGGQRWRAMRSTLSPMFTNIKVKEMFRLIAECGRQMVKFCLIEDAHDKIQIYEMKSFFTKASHDVIATCAFGINVDSFQNGDNVFYTMGNKITEYGGINLALKFLSFRSLPKLLRLFEIDFFNKDIKKFFSKTVMDTMRVRLEMGYVRRDLIDLLVQVKNGRLRRVEVSDTEKEEIGYAAAEEVVMENEYKTILTDDDIVAQCLQFFFAGLDTVASLLSFISYELALNGDVQEKLYQELITMNSNLRGRPLTFTDLQELQYLDMVISEGLRKWPPAVNADRRCVKDYLYDDGVNKFTIEKGTPIWIPIITLHHDPQYFPNPEVFDPERFSDENKKHIKSGTYIPFGSGTRNCIGSRFALIEAKVLLFYFLINFKILITEKTQIPLQLTKLPLTMSPAKGIWLELKKR